MSKLSNAMRDLLSGRYYATLATLNDDGSIHVIPVWFLFENDRLHVQSSSMSRKVKNVTARPDVSLMVDVRKLGSEKWVYASGRAEIVGGAESMQINAKILNSLDMGSEAFKLTRALLMGEDEFGMNFITACREGVI